MKQTLLVTFLVPFLSILNGNVSTLAQISFLARCYRIQDGACRHSDGLCDLIVMVKNWQRLKYNEGYRQLELRSYVILAMRLVCRQDAFLTLDMMWLHKSR